MRKKGIAAIALIAMMFTVGCGAKVDEVKELEVSSNKQEENKEENKEETKEEATVMTTEGFYNLNDVLEKYSFAMRKEDEDRTKYVGEYALDSDETYEIAIGENIDSTNEVYIDINGNRSVIDDVCDLVDAKIIDINQNDNSKEIVLYDNGMSDDLTLIFVKVVDGKACEIGYASAIYDYNEVLFDKNGKVISGYSYVQFSEPQIVDEYKELKDGALVNVDAKSENAFGKKYKIGKEKVVSFAETEDTNLENAYSYFTEEHTTLKVGEEITIIKADISATVYYVELSDGRRGVMITQLAG